ncbi:MAG TPA: hypothetical protein P5060_01415 [Candidatus Absconditabacterales bacterium]|nr:hypothetical protein [Candidatus Absconditabacterales bacterium]
MGKSLIRLSWDEKNIDELEKIKSNMKSPRNREIISRYIEARKRRLNLFGNYKKIIRHEIVTV